MSSKILIVDDSSTDRIIISNMLRNYDLYTATDGFEALDIIADHIDFDIIILDLNMPKMDGFEVLRKIKSEEVVCHADVIILTNYEEIENEIMGLDLGAVDYIRKPLNVESTLKRVEVHLELSRAKKKIEHHNQILEETVQKRTEELVVSRDITIRALVGLLEVRDLESSNHTKRTQWMMKKLCDHLMSKSFCEDILTEEYSNELFKTAPLHDIGKVGIPDSILMKKGKLNTEEYEQMKNHVMYGVDALTHEVHQDYIGPFIKAGLEIVGNHHEKFDGTGYPNGLKGKDIPLAGRLMAIIDVYDALTSKRIYKDAFQHEYSLDLIIKESGKHFDPDIVEAFLEIEQEIYDISQKYMPKIKEED